MPITTGDVEFMIEVFGSTIVFGEYDAEPIMVVTTLESVCFEADPLSRILKIHPATRLK